MVINIAHEEIEKCLRECNEINEHLRVLIIDEKFSNETYHVVVWSIPITYKNTKYMPSRFLASFDNLDEAVVWAELELNIGKDNIEFQHVEYRQIDYSALKILNKRQFYGQAI